MFSKTSTAVAPPVFNPQDKTKMKQALLKKVTTLLPGDEAILKEAKEVIESDNFHKKIQFSKEKLSDVKGSCNASVVLRLCANNEWFKALCMDEKLPHLEMWSQHLKDKNYIGENLLSIDKQMSISVVDEYIGSYLYDYYQKITKIEKPNPYINEAVLELAAELGSFYAIIERIKQNAENLKLTMKSETISPEDKLAAHTQFEIASNSFCNQYWSVGYLYMSLIYLDVGISIGNEAMKEKEDLKKPGDDYRLVAYQLFLKAKEFDAYKKVSENKKVIDAICKQQGLSIFGAQGWEGGELFYLQFLRKNLYQPSVIQAMRKKIKEEIQAIMTVRSQSSPRHK